MEDERARVRARARKKKRRRQRRMLLGIGLLLILTLIGAAIYGVMRFTREKKKQELLTEGIALLDQGNYEDAIRNLDDALKWSKGKVGEFERDALLYRGEAEFRLKDYDAALNTYELLLKEDGENAEYKKGAAHCLVEKKDYDGALAYGVINGYVYNLKAVEQINDGEYDAALELIRQGMEAGDSRQDLAYNQAVAWENKGDFAKALELFEDYASQYGTDENVEREIAFLRSRQGGGQDDTAGDSGAGESGEEGEPGGSEENGSAAVSSDGETESSQENGSVG